MSKIYELTITRDYVSSWGVVQAVRELLQNALDHKSPFEWGYNSNNECFTITSMNAQLPIKTLLLGATTKSDEVTSVGQFGEGYKLALLVLTRMRKTVTVYNGPVTWVPQLAMSKMYMEETLQIVETPRYGVTNDLVFQINGIMIDEFNAIKNSCISMWEEQDLGEVINVEYGKILLGHEGKLFVKGLFICDTDLEYGYDILPEFIKLERDRETVSSWDLKFQVSKMWAKSKRFDLINDGLNKSLLDMSLLEYQPLGDDLVDAVVKDFHEKHGSKIAISEHSEMNGMIADGIKNAVFVPSAVKQILNKSAEYRATLPTPKEVVSIQSQLETWYNALDSTELYHDSRMEFEKIIQESENWVRGS